MSAEGSNDLVQRASVIRVGRREGSRGDRDQPLPAVRRLLRRGARPRRRATRGRRRRPRAARRRPVRARRGRAGARSGTAAWASAPPAATPSSSSTRSRACSARSEWAALEAGLAQRVRALDAFVADVYGPAARGRRGRRAGAADRDLRRPRARDARRAPGGRHVGRRSPAWTSCATPPASCSCSRTTCARRAASPTRSRRAAPCSPRSTSPRSSRRARSRGCPSCSARRCARPRPRASRTRTSWCSPTGRTTAPRSSTRGPPSSSGSRSSSRTSSSCAATCCATAAARSTSSTAARTPTRSTREVGRLLVPPLRAGTLGLVNAFGTGVADDKLAHAYVEDLVRFHLGEEPLLRSVPTFDLCVPEQLERALDELETLVVKPRTRPRRARRDRLPARRARGRRADARAADRAAGGLRRPADDRDLPASDGDRRRARSRGTSTCDPSCSCAATGRPR